MLRVLVLSFLLCCCVGEVSGVGGGSGGGAVGGDGGGDAGGAAGGAAGGEAGGATAGGDGGGAAGGSTAGGAGGGMAGGSTAGGAGGGTAGGATAGGSGGGGGTGGGSAADAGACTAMFCDDFERYDAGRAPTAPWTTPNLNGGTVSVDTARSHSGGKSVHVTTDGNQDYREAYFGMRGPFFPVAGNAFYGRAWFYVTAVPTMTTHWTNISGEGAVPDAGTNVRAYVRYGGQVMKHIMANYDTSGVGSDCWQHSNVAMPAGTWNCYEWHFDQPNNKMELWLDGTQIQALTVNGQGMGCITNGLGGKWLLPQFDLLRLGWEHYQTSIPISMWIDDVALDTQRIGCAP